jgi:hypothetical protein
MASKPASSRSATRSPRRSEGASRAKAATRPAPAKMQAYASFDLYVAGQVAAHRPILQALRRFVAAAAPDLVEAVKWGNGCWLSGPGPIAYVYSAPDHVQFGFLQGSKLSDPKGLLQGEGQYVRHTKLRARRDLDAEAFAALLEQAIRIGPPVRSAKTKRAAKPKPKPKPKLKLKLKPKPQPMLQPQRRRPAR